MKNPATSASGFSMHRRAFLKVASLTGWAAAAECLLHRSPTVAEAADQVALTRGGVVPQAADFYVALTGDDDAVGNQAAPFRTLAKAQSALRARRPTDKPVTVWVRGGTYFLNAPLVFTPADSGSPEAPVTFAAYPAETVILSGGVKLKPAWTIHVGGIMVASIGAGYEFDMLFLNGDQPLILARYPNYDAAKVPLQGCADYADRVSKWGNPAGGFIRAMHNAGWGGNSFKITGKDGPKLVLAWVGDNNRGQSHHSKHQVVENIFEELDAPGEWFYDQADGRLYLYPPVGTNLASSFVVGAIQEELIRVVGTADAKVQNLNFFGFTFTHTHRTLFTSTYEGLSQGDWAIARKGTVYLQDARNVQVRDCNFMNIGGNGVFMSGHNQNNVVTGCNFVHVGATAVAVVGLPSSTQYYCTWKNDKQMPTTLIPGPATENYPKNITISYCYMYDTGVFEKQTAAVLISISQAVTVSHCTAHYGPRSGINVEDGTFGGHVIEFNDVFDQVRETSDHGPFNSWGRDRWWNRMSRDEQRKNAFLDVVQPITIRNNRFSVPAGTASYGIDLDDGSSNYRISNNLLVNCGFKSQLGFAHSFTNNIILNSLATFHQWVLPDMEKTVSKNIFVNDKPYFCRSRDFRPNTGLIDYNLFWNNGSAINLQLDGKGNDTARPTWEQLKLDAHSVTADPQFVDPACGDYTVKASSPALTLGFQNFPMNQFGKPGYPVPPGFRPTTPQTGDRFAADSLPTLVLMRSTVPKVDLGPTGE